jgi:hypothetical protein
MNAPKRQTAMPRRAAIRKLAAGGIGAAASALWVDRLAALTREQAIHAHAGIAASAQAAAPWTAKVLNPHQLETVATLSELIIPQTDTPGARGALVDRFVDEVLRTAPPAERAGFLKGIAWMDARSRTLFGKDVVSAAPAQQTDLLTRLSVANSSEARAGIDFFTAIKSMTITGYYTSEIGLRQELGDDGVLAQATFEGCTHPEHQG